ncbi:MAG: hypothetical protein COA50_00345 [Flavobacteriaceae bacterium]|nr:MAG: hypothetical protein COA50_00345 [Flavobacteriaceae bacterium]
MSFVRNRIVLALFGLFGILGVSAQTSFEDVTEAAGINHQFEVFEGMFGGGITVFDFNNDGFEDLFITSGMKEDVLYLNNGDGTFKNIYGTSGLQITKDFITQGTASADVNKDGWVDLVVTTLSTKDTTKIIPRAKNLLFINNGDMTFRDATKEYGLNSLYSFSTGASFGDVNADGYPDLYIGNYFLEYEGELSEINDATIVNANQTAKGYLLINKGGKSFSNEYEAYGMSHRGFGFGALFTDFDNDADQDVIVNHDFGYKAVPSLLLENKHPRKGFKDISAEKEMDLKINAMGAAIGDYDNNGLLDYFITNIRFNLFMVNGGDDPFVDMAKDLGTSLMSISWGANFADFDHDTDLDLYVSNGDLNPNCVPMPDFYFENNNGSFTEKAWEIGLNDYGIGRGSVIFDIENDGDMDILVVNQKAILPGYPVPSKTSLFRNNSAKGNWLKVALKGIQSETRGIGSKVEVVIGDTHMIREIDGGGSSHLSQNSTIAHFGLGNATKVDAVIVTWLGGKQQLLTNQPINTLLEIVEIEEKKNSLYIILAVLFAIAALVIVYLVRRSKSKS